MTMIDADTARAALAANRNPNRIPSDSFDRRTLPIHGGNRNQIPSTNESQAAAAARGAPVVSGEKLVGQIFTQLPPETPINTDPDFGRLNNSEIKILRFPFDLENPRSSSDAPYVMFKIFETQTYDEDVTITDQSTGALRSGFGVIDSIVKGIPTGDKIASTIAGGALGGLSGALFGFGLSTETGRDIINDVATRTFVPVGNNTPFQITSVAKDLIKGFALKRNTQQLALAIALFMPDGITTNYNQEFETLSVTAATGAVGFAAQALSSKDGFVVERNPFVAESVAKISSKILGNDEFGRLGLFATTGMVTNPQLETIYTSPKLRQFVFDFRLVPRNANESSMIRTIINRFKFFSSPQIKGGTGGRYFVPPAQFEIEFYNADSSTNDFLFKTKKCVLEGISVDYSPNGFATFDDGAPVETRLQLSFLETAIIDRNDIDRGH